MGDSREGGLLEWAKVSLKHNKEAQSAIAFAEKFLTLLDEGSYNTTYKFAVLLALMDLVIEHASKDGTPASTITTKQLADKVISIYWNQVNPYEALNSVALQGKSGQAEILNDIRKYRETTGFRSIFQVRRSADDKYLRLVNRVEKKLIEMPLPRVQYFGNQENRFIYDIEWSKQHPQDLKQVSAYQNNQASSFDNRIHLLPNVADYLVNLNGLLRPMVQRMWAMEVARINKLEESKLEHFLFGTERAVITKFTEPLRELQNNQCFYCETKFGSSLIKKPAVDHFIPWSRVPNDGLANFVLAHADCNNSKSDHIAAKEHLDHWKERNTDQATLNELELVAFQLDWEVKEQSSLGIAETFYSRLKPGVELWVAKGRFQHYA